MVYPMAERGTLRSLFMKLGKKLEVEVQKCDISCTIHRLPGRSNVTAIVARLNNRDLKSEMIRASKRKRLTSDVLGFEAVNPIYCAEHLTAYTAAILKKAKQLKRDDLLASSLHLDQELHRIRQRETVRPIRL